MLKSFSLTCLYKVSFSSKFLSILVGVIYFRQDYDQAGVASLVGAIYWMVLHLTFSNYTSVLSVRNGAQSTCSARL